MSPLGCFDAASRGAIEAYMGAPLYWAAIEPAFSSFDTIPFGMNPAGITASYYQGNGLGLAEEAYGAFNLVPRPGTASNPQMAGWFRKKVSTIGDDTGSRCASAQPSVERCMSKRGHSGPHPADEIYAALERGVIDACESVRPHDDMKLRLHKTARHYYYPGWHEPGSMNEFGFNRKAYEMLPVELRRILDQAATATQGYGLTEFDAKNAIALERLKSEFKGKVEILPLPAAVLRDLKKLAAEVVREGSEKSSMARKVHASYTKFQAQLAGWSRISEGAYHQLAAL